MRRRESKVSINLAPSITIAGVWLALLMPGSARLAAAQTETVIHRFQNQYHGGLSPSGGLVADPTGALYGTTLLGGKRVHGLSYGAVYRLSPPSIAGGAWQEKVLYSFTAGGGGQNPNGGVLIEGKTSKVYGTAGSESGFGLVYELTPGSPWTESVLYSFTGPDGSDPNGGLISDDSGALYGTTSQGGTFTCNGGDTGCGVVYKLTPPTKASGAWTEQILYSFQGGDDGSQPSGGLTFDRNGALYGLAFLGGSGAAGVVYKLTPPADRGGLWTESVIHSFSGVLGSSEGAFPLGALTVDRTGRLYGTTNDFGQYGYGNVYQLTPPGSAGGDWTETILYQFTGGSDGGVPDAGVVRGTNGALYGTTALGGQVTGGNGQCANGGFGCGTVFKLVPPSTRGGSWTETVLHAFSNFEGYPNSPVLLLGNDLYGITPQYNSDTTPAPGTAFQIKP
jgi:hypothetical protein